MQKQPNTPHTAPFTPLSKEERGDMRLALESFMHAHPIPEGAGASIRSPYSGLSALHIFMQAHYRLPVAAVLILLLSGGTAFAAEGALPGDPLYPVKINVNERIETAVALTPTASAKVEVKHALTRLSEAQQLAAKGKLDDKTRTVVEAQFSKDVAAVHQNVAALETSGNRDAAASVNAEFETGLDSHLALVSNDDEASGTSSASAKAAVPQATAPVAFSARIATSVDTAEEDTTATSTVSAQDPRVELERAQHELASLRVYLQSHKQGMNAAARQVALGKLAVGASLIAQGKESLTSGHDDDAYASFRDALQAGADARASFGLPLLERPESAPLNASAMSTTTPESAEEGSSTIRIELP